MNTAFTRQLFSGVNFAKRPAPRGELEHPLHPVHPPLVNEPRECAAWGTRRRRRRSRRSVHSREETGTPGGWSSFNGFGAPRVGAAQGLLLGSARTPPAGPSLRNPSSRPRGFGTASLSVISRFDGVSPIYS